MLGPKPLVLVDYDFEVVGTGHMSNLAEATDTLGSPLADLLQAPRSFAPGDLDSGPQSPRVE